MTTEIEFYGTESVPAFFRNPGTGQIIRIGEWTPAQLRHIAGEIERMQGVADKAIGEAQQKDPRRN